MEVIAIVLVICGAIFVATICCCFNLCKHPLQVYSLDYKCILYIYKDKLQLVLDIYYLFRNQDLWSWF